MPCLNLVRDCYGNERRCKQGTDISQNRMYCYPQSYNCDGWVDCTCGSDEANCYNPCPTNETLCPGGG